MRSRVAVVDGARVELLGDAWVAFSPASGETLFLNDESAAVLEVLAAGPLEPSEVHSRLAADSGVGADELRPLVDESWPRLVEAGLVRWVD